MNTATREPRVVPYDSGGNHVGEGNGRAAWYRAGAFDRVLPADIPGALFDAIIRLGLAPRPASAIAPIWFPSRAAALAALEAAEAAITQSRRAET